MLLRLKSLIVLAFMLLALYLVLWRDDTPFTSGEHPVDVLHGNNGEMKDEGGLEVAPILDDIPLLLATTKESRPTQSYAHIYSTSVGSASAKYLLPTSSVRKRPSTTVPTLQSSSTNEASNTIEKGSSQLQEQFQQENDALSLGETTGILYGKTLSRLVDVGAHEGFNAAHLTPTKSLTAFHDTPPYTYNPYPDYNSKSWSSGNQGVYRACNGPEGPIKDWTVFSGHPKVFGYPHIGSYVPFDIDSNLCFERETRLGPYGFQETDALGVGNSSFNTERKRSIDWDSIDWGFLQHDCLRENSDRFADIEEDKRETGTPLIGMNSSNSSNSTTILRRLEKVNDTISEEGTVSQGGANDNDSGPALHGMPEFTITPKSRTAVLIRTHSNQTYTENDKQNIRSLITELCLRSGAEYQVFLLVQAKDDNLPESADPTAYNKILQASVPAEFRNMTVMWSDAQMKKLYPLIPAEVNNVHQSQWLSVQKFAQDHPKFDHYFNWEFDTRFTGHHYNLLEKLATFAKKQPRKGLWERNERYYIPSFHDRFSTFRLSVQKVAGDDTIWGPPPTPGVVPVGPNAPGLEPKDDSFRWGVGEEADYISLAPMFNPVNTSWVGKNDVWGYDGLNTPRRATIGTHSRCSKKLLDTMHAENLKGNHVSSEMTPQTVALLHGFKAVFAPIPMYMDRDWSGQSLEKFFNPGPKGESGSTIESPFSWGRESRFAGSTWYFRANPPMRLYNNWLGWEDSGIGGPEWEKAHGRMCLPAILLHPIKNVVEPEPGFSSKSDLPY
ncbi:hypothetical protein ONS95_003231 [Cadophora gregata]|uniref:uncharacterized protein n=1 Tax=Cadophora gregata TaxID=51156 RepID=UPI0026DB6C58|nr:uncharacterized protein ONS95_003231 [Cadophora gregata]KAK0108423.1 hypothetical protein ONS95_003231 [Cadophora gregata]KAK0108983.1 hypothetical protein ONS96_002820 [Cadophora gregata f. sp. sojae]